MTRKKIEITWIENDAARRASLKKRRIGLLKKVSELTVLCGLDAFCIIYSPDEVEPVVWPSPSIVRELIMRFRDLPKFERYKKATNQATFLKERIVKAKDQLKKLQKKYNDVNFSWYMYQVYNEGKDLHEFDGEELYCFAWLLFEKINEYSKRRASALPPTSFVPQQVHDTEGFGLAEGVISGGNGGGGDGQHIEATYDPYHWNHCVKDTMINNSENVVGGVGMEVSYGFNLSDFGSNVGEMHMGNFCKGNVRHILTSQSNSSLGHPHGDFFKEGGNNRTDGNLEQLYVGLRGVNRGGEVNEPVIPQGNMEDSLLGIPMMTLLNNNLGGGYNNENIVVPYGKWEGVNGRGSFPSMHRSYNNQMGVGNNYGMNLDQLELPYMTMDGLGNQIVGLPRGNTLGHRNNHNDMDLGNCRGIVVDGLGNAMEAVPNSNVVKGHGNEMVSRLPGEQIVHGPGSDQEDEGNDVNDWDSTVGDCGGSIAGSDVGFHSSFFEAESDMEQPYDVTKAWPNNLSP